jgi:SAM-dependent methyltransferase
VSQQGHGASIGTPSDGPQEAADTAATGLAFTGERFVPGTVGEIAQEHWHRYAFAQALVRGRRVLDVASGEGYGSAWLAREAAQVTGVDIDARAVGHAASTYRAPNLRFTVGSATDLPLAASSVDAVVSFETLEHLPREAQAGMIAEFDRVLAPDGFLVLSSPNRPQYSDARDYRNPFHLHELDRDELAALLGGAFGARRWFRQRRFIGSALWSEDGGSAFEAWAGDARAAAAARPPEAMYFVVVAAREEHALPRAAAALSLFGDADDREERRLEAQAREVLRLDDLVKARDRALDAQTAHVRHLEMLVAERERLVEARDAELREHVATRDAQTRALDGTRAELAHASTALGSARQAVDALEAERERLERAIAAQERIIAYRQSARWWMQLPWLRVRHLWQK